MDHNRNGLALMISALLISLVVVSMRSCNDKAASRYEALDRQSAVLATHLYTVTAPIHDYKIKSIDGPDGVMIVEVGHSLTVPQIRTLADRLLTAFHQADHAILNSDLFFVRIERDGRRIATAQTSVSGNFVKVFH